MSCQVLRERNRGYGILVSALPKESNALYSLRDPSEVQNHIIVVENDTASANWHDFFGGSFVINHSSSLIYPSVLVALIQI